MNAIYIALPFVQFALSLFLANIVVASDPSNRVNRLFTLFLLAMAGWGIAIFGMRDAFPDETVAFTRDKIALGVIPFSSVLFYHFTLRYTRGASRNRTLLLFYGLAGAAAVLAMTNQVATGMSVKFYGFAPELGWAFGVLVIAAYPPIIGAFIRITAVGRVEDDQRVRKQLNLLRLGIVALVLGGTSDFFPSLGLNIYPMGIVGNLFFVGLATWGVTRYRLMELRLVLRRGLAYSAVSSTLFAVYGASFAAVFLLAGSLSTPALVMTAVGAIILVGVIVQPAIARLQAVVDRAFFRERGDRVAGLARLNELTKDITDFSAVARGITETVRRTVQADWVAIALPEDRRGSLVGVASTGSMESALNMPQRGHVIAHLRKNQTIARVAELRPTDPAEASRPSSVEMMEELDALSYAGAHLLVPMIVGGNLTGVMVLGGRLVGSDYNSEDYGFLAAAADQASIAVENARLYANTRREADERSAVAELARVVGSTLDIGDVMALCAHQVRTLLKADRVEIARVEDDESNFHLAHVEGLDVPGWVRGSGGSTEEAHFRTALEYRRGELLDLTSSDSSRSPAALSAACAGLVSMIAVPLISKEKTIGTLNILSRDPDAYGPEELELAQRIGAQVTNAISNSLLYEQALLLAEEREARARLDAENRELQRVNEAKIEFLSMVSHELRTPLTSMMAFADILRNNKRGNLEEKDVSRIDVIRRNGRRLSLLISDLLDVSRMESGSLKLDISEFEMNQMVEELHESFVPLLEAKRQTLKLELPPEIATCFADRDRIAQVVSNLMSNASKYSPDSSEVRLSMRSDQDTVYIAVEDRGIGISEEDQKQLFTSFFRADNEETRAAPGTGLGLVIVKGIIEMHRGKIWIESEFGKGTTAHVQFSRRCDIAENKDAPDAGIVKAA